MSSVSPELSKKVVIIGGGASGRSVAEALLKTAKNAPSITIVQPHEYHASPVFAPYFLAHPDEIDARWNTKKGSATEISQVSIQGVEYAFGKVTTVDADEQTLTISAGDGTSAKLRYEVLVVAVGVDYPVITPTDDLITLAQLKHFYKHTFPKAVQNARSVLIGGAGAVACEMAGTIRTLSPSCSITMVSSSQTALPAWEGSGGGKAVNSYLKQLNVELITNERMQESDHSLTRGSYTLMKSGDVITADIYLPFFGTVPTSSFMPVGTCEDGTGRVKVNNKGQSKLHPSMYAVGCGSEVRMSSYNNITKEVNTVTQNIIAAKMNTDANANANANANAGVVLPLSSMEKDLAYMHFVWGQYSVVNPPFPASLCCRAMGCPLCFFCPCCLVCGWNGCHPAGKLPSCCMKAAFFDSAGAPHLKPFKNMDKEPKQIKKATMQR
jgi:NADH dehydrogenase FAD-containing subunit